MGMFLHTAIIKNTTEAEVLACLPEIASTYTEMTIIPEECRFLSYKDAIGVWFNDSVNGYEELAEVISQKLSTTTLLLYIYDDDYWGYYLSQNGVILDRFCPIPDYFNFDDYEIEALKGDVSTLVKFFGGDPLNLQRYLVPWTDEMIDSSEEKAYEDDKLTYGDCWQMADFMRALGYPFGYDDIENNESHSLKYDPTLHEIVYENLQPLPLIPMSKDEFSYNIGNLPNSLNYAHIKELLDTEREPFVKSLSKMNISTIPSLIEKEFEAGLQNSSANLYTILSFTHHWLGSPTGCYMSLSKALDFEPNNIMLLRARGLIATMHSMVHSGTADLSKLLSLDEKNYKIYLLCRSFFHWLNLSFNECNNDIKELMLIGFPIEIDSNICKKGFHPSFIQYLDNYTKQKDLILTFNLLPNENLIWSETVSMRREYRFVFIVADTATLYITNQRILLTDCILPLSCTLDEIQCFKNGDSASTTLVKKDGTEYNFRSSSTTQIHDWLRTAGLKEEVNPIGQTNRPMKNIDPKLLYALKSSAGLPQIPYDLKKHKSLTDFSQILDPYYENIAEWLVVIPGDFSLLGEVVNLHTLSFGTNNQEKLTIQDFSFLKNLTKLKNLKMPQTNFSDCSLLADLPSLKSVYLPPKSQLTNIEHLKALVATISFADEDKVEPTVYSGASFGRKTLLNALSPEYIESLITPETKEIWKLLGCREGAKAKEMLDSIIAETPTDYKLYILRAYCSLYTNGNGIKIDAELANALQYDPDNIMILRYRCSLYASKKRYLQHIEDLTRLIDIDPEQSSEYFLDRGWKYYWVGDLDAAKADVAVLLERGALLSTGDMSALCKNLEIDI